MLKDAKEFNVFDEINAYIRGTEGSFVNLISALAPWGAPSPVAYMTFDHCLTALHFPGPIALVTALVVEALGISSISTALSFWAHNKKVTDRKNKSPLTLAIATFAFYIAVVLSLNVVLDAEKLWSAENLKAGEQAISVGMIVGRALLSLLSIPAGVLLATRAEQTELIKSVEAQEIERNRVTSEQKAFELEKIRLEQEFQRQQQQEAQEAARRLFLEQQEAERQIRAEQAAERERMARIEADLKIKKAAIRKGLYSESSPKVSESFGNSAAESSDFANFPRNWRKMSTAQKGQLADYISQHNKEIVAADFNVTVRTVENWIVSLIDEGYLAES